MDMDEEIALDALREARLKLEVLRGLQDVAINMITNFYGTKICNETGFKELAIQAFVNAKEIVDSHTINIVSQILIED